MKQDKIIAITVSLITVILSILFFINDKKEFSENENRYLTKFPEYTFSSLKSGKYTEKVKDYLTDHFPLRDYMMSLKTKTYKVIGIKEINDVYFGEDGYLIEKFKPFKNIDKITKIINNFKEKTNLNIKVMLIPTSVSINEDKLPKYAINEDQIEVIEEFYNKLNTENINIHDTLLVNKENFQIYYKLDHHWTTHGAYLAYLKYCENVGISGITDYNIKEVSNEFYGTLYSKTNDYALKPDSIHIYELDDTSFNVIYDNEKTTNTLYDESYLAKKDKYSYFLDNNHALIQITNEKISNENSLLIIKDSYANSFVPFIVNHYKNVYVIDPRFYKQEISKFIKEKELNDVLLLYNLNTLDNDLGIVTLR